jgi:hypothetical protein
LVWDGGPIFGETTVAWDWGPVVKDLYAQHRGEPFVASLPKGDPSALDSAHMKTIEAVLDFYSTHDEFWLSKLSHAEEPWATTANNDAIPLEAMRDFYSKYPTPPYEISPEVARGFSFLVTLPEELRDDVITEQTRPIEGLEEWLTKGTGNPWRTSGG